MPRRTLLSSEQRIRLFSIPIEAAEMARHFVLSTEDLTLVRTKRRAANRLGFAVQLCALRHPGRVLDPAELPPEQMLAFVGKQIGTDPALFGEYARRAETRREHMTELQKLLRLRTFGFADWRSCLKAGTDAAWATDRGEPIVQAMIAHLRANNVLLPTVNVLERIGLAARARARKKVFEALADGLTAAEQDALEKLLAIDPELRRSRFAWLRDYSESPAPSNILALLDRLEYARGLGIGHKHAARIHPERAHPQAVIIVSDDRKNDWYHKITEADIDTDLKNLRARWDPVPRPHPTLLFELQQKAKVDHLILLDRLYLGALLWRKEQARCGRFAEVAIGIVPALGKRDDRPVTPPVKRSQKRSTTATFGLTDAVRLITASSEIADHVVTPLLLQLDANGPERDTFVAEFAEVHFATLNPQQMATFARILHDRAVENQLTAEALLADLLDRLDKAEPNAAASLFAGVLVSAYMADGQPRPCPRSPFLEQIFFWQDDPAFTKVLQAFQIHLRRACSPALYIPNTKNARVTVTLIHDARTRQIPVELVQIAFNGTNLLDSGETRPELSLRKWLNDSAEASVENVVKAACAYYGVPFALTDVEGGATDELRSIPELMGFREFDRFSQVSAGEHESADLPSEPDTILEQGEEDAMDELDADEPIIDDEEDELE